MSASPKVNQLDPIELLVAALLPRLTLLVEETVADALQAHSEAVEIIEAGKIARQPKAEKPAQKQRSKARKPKADAIAPDGFEVGSQFVYTASPKGNAKAGAKSTWTVRSIEDAAVMAYRQGTSKARPWKFTSIAAMLQSGNISTDLSTVVTKPKARSRKAA